MQRDPAPEIVRWQLEHTQMMTEDVLKLYYAAADRFEGDDVIHTISTMALNGDHSFDQVHIIGDDKDLFSLCRDRRVTIHRMTGSPSPKLIHVQCPEEEAIPDPDYKVLPSQIPDFLALAGDRVDNIPVFNPCAFRIDD